MRVNLDVAKDVCNANGPFSDTGWMAVMSTGTLSHLRPDIIEILSRAYALVRRTIFFLCVLQDKSF